MNVGSAKISARSGTAVADTLILTPFSTVLPSGLPYRPPADKKPEIGLRLTYVGLEAERNTLLCNA